MNSLYNKKEVEDNFENVLKYLSDFAYKYRTQSNIENQIKGELFNLIRRHIPHLINTRIGFSKSNIDTVYFDQVKGTILYIRFVKTYSGCYDEFIIDELNSTLLKLDNNFSNYALGSKLSETTKKIRGITFK